MINGENLKFTYDECLKFISDILDIKLTYSQKLIIKAMMSDNYRFIINDLFPRGVTKTPYCSKLIDAYMGNKYDSVAKHDNHVDCQFIKCLK